MSMESAGFDAQVQPSVSLQGLDRHLSYSAGHDTLLQSHRAEQQMEAENVRELPDAIVSDGHSGDRRRQEKRMRERQEIKHRDTLEGLNAQLVSISQHYESKIRQACRQLLSSVAVQDQTKDTLQKKQKKKVKGEGEAWRRIKKLDLLLLQYETQRSTEVSGLLRKCCLALEVIGFLNPPDVYRLINGVAMNINQELLSNRRSIARLRLHLLEEDLQKESLQRLHLQEQILASKRSRVDLLFTRVQDLICSSGNDQQEALELRRSLQKLSELRHNIIKKLCSLVLPTCSTELVADWSNQLKAVNHKIDCLHSNYLQQAGVRCELTWQSCQKETQRCQEELRAEEVSEQEVHRVTSQLQSLIGQRQRQSKQRLAALKGAFDCLSRQSDDLNRCVCALLHGAVLLWEEHQCAMDTREQQLEKELQHLGHLLEKQIQKKEAELDVLLDHLRQASTEKVLKSSLEKAQKHLGFLTKCYGDWYTGVCQLVDRLPVDVLVELNAYSSALSHCFQFNHGYTLSPEEIQQTYPSICLDVSEGAKHPPMSSQDIESTQKRSLPEVKSCLAELCDAGSSVNYTTQRGAVYTGPAFSITGPIPFEDLKEETEYAQFPSEILTNTLTRMLVSLLDHVEQHFHDVLRDTVAVVADRKQALLSQHQHFLFLHKPRTQRLTDIHNARAADLQRHRQCVGEVCDKVQKEMPSIRQEFLHFQEHLVAKSQDFSSSSKKLQLASSSLLLVSEFSSIQESYDAYQDEVQISVRDFKQSVSQRMHLLHGTITSLLRSFRLFSEGGDFSREEAEVFSKRIEEEKTFLDQEECSLQTDLDSVQTTILEQVKVMRRCQQEKFSLVSVELSLLDKVKSVLTNMQVHLKTKAACSHQQQKVLTNRVEDLRRSLENTQVSPEDVFSLLSYVDKELVTRFCYLDCFLDSSDLLDPQKPLQGHFSLATRLKTNSATPTGSVLATPSRQPLGTDMNHDDIIVGVIQSLNKFTMIQDEQKECSGTAIRLGQRSTSANVSMRRPSKKDFQVFGENPPVDKQSFMSIVNRLLWKTNDVLLQAGMDFYSKLSQNVGMFILPKSFDQWAESMTQRMLGYQKQSLHFNTSSVQELLPLLCVLDQVLSRLPGVVLGNHSKRWEAELLGELGGVTTRLAETLRASEEKKKAHISRLGVSLRLPTFEEEVAALRSREEARQEELLAAISKAQLELKESVRVRWGEFETSLSSLVDSILEHMTRMTTPLLGVPETWGSEKPQEGAPQEEETSLEPGATIWTSQVREQKNAIYERSLQVCRSQLCQFEKDTNSQVELVHRWRRHWDTHILTQLNTE